MAKKKLDAQVPEKSAADLAIEGFRAAHREWDRAIPPVGFGITAGNADGLLCTWNYWLPTGYFVPTTAEEAARFGFATPDWSTLSQPILPPTDEKWRASYDACAAARVVLANAADQLAAAVHGNDDSSRHLRAGAKRLAGMLRDVPPVWPKKVETDLAFEINNYRIVEFQQALAHAATNAEEDESERLRLEHKQRNVTEAREDVPGLFSLWQQTTDLLFRTNLPESSRVVELALLRSIVFSLTLAARKQQMPRENLQKLDSTLRLLMPREWFHKAADHAKVAEAVHAANVEVVELYLAFVKPGLPPPPPPSAVVPKNGGIAPKAPSARGRKQRDWSPSSEPSVIRFVRAAEGLAAARPKKPGTKKEPLALAGIYSKAGLRGASQTRAKDAAVRLKLVDRGFWPTARGRKLLKNHPA